MMSFRSSRFLSVMGLFISVVAVGQELSPELLRTNAKQDLESHLVGELRGADLKAAIRLAANQEESMAFQQELLSAGIERYTKKVQAYYPNVLKYAIRANLEVMKGYNIAELVKLDGCLGIMDQTYRTDVLRYGESILAQASRFTVESISTQILNYQVQKLERTIIACMNPSEVLKAYDEEKKQQASTGLWNSDMQRTHNLFQNVIGKNSMTTVRNLLDMDLQELEKKELAYLSKE